MQVREVMTSNPACCTPRTPLRDVAQMMLDHDCGEIPVVENMENRRPLGVVTDRDIAIRTVAQGVDPRNASAGDAMTAPAITVKADTELEKCLEVMENKQIRRVPVVDDSGAVCGIVAQADVALRADRKEAAEVVEEVSKPKKKLT